MITAVDTSVLLDVLLPDPVFGPASAQALRQAISEGGLIACEVVWAEVGALFPSASEAATALDDLTVGFSAMGADEAGTAGRAWSAYRARGGSRDRMVADFLIGAHAAGRSDRLLTRDRGFYRKDFSGLPLLDPSGPALPEQ